MSAAKELKFTTLEAAVHVACDSEPANYSKAADLLLTILADNPDLYQAVAQPLVAAQVRTMISSEIRRRNKVGYGMAVNSAIKDQFDVKALINSKVRTLMETALQSCNKLLRDATKAEVSENARQYQVRAKGNQREAAWFMLIAKRMQDDQTVGTAMTEEDLVKMRQQTEK